MLSVKVKIVENKMTATTKKSSYHPVLKEFSLLMFICTIWSETINKSVR